MRIIVFSDSHRNHRNVRRLFEQTHLTADLYICLGDAEGDLDGISALYPDKQILQVAGNCDYGSDLPLMDTVTAEGKKIIFTHGHQHMVNFGLFKLKSLAEDNHADVVLFGHTHARRCEYKDGVYYINPGSLGKPRDGLPPSYAALDVIPAGILCTHAELDD